MTVEKPVYTSPDDKVAWLGTDPIPAKAYYDPEWFELERQAIFMRTWIEVGHVCELPEPGTWIRRELEFANASILIVRGKDNLIRAFYNACTHRGTQLVEGCGHLRQFVCPFHGWRFDGTGRNCGVPWNPDAKLAQAGFEDYMQDGIFAALDAVEKATGVKDPNCVGYCIGGTLLSATLAYMAAKGDNHGQGSASPEGLSLENGFHR